MAEISNFDLNIPMSFEEIPDEKVLANEINLNIDFNFNGSGEISLHNNGDIIASNSDLNNPLFELNTDTDIVKLILYYS